MLGENKNLKNNLSPSLSPSEEKGMDLVYKINRLSFTYTKTNKLITALYMVTDIMDKDEPLKNKLRTLSVNIISDIHSSAKKSLIENIDEILSLLDIASAIGMVSEMNCNILKKEFFELKRSVEEYNIQDKANYLEEFFSESPLLDKEGVGGGNLQNHHLAQRALLLNKEEKNKLNSNRHIGVQKPDTLLKALNKIEMSNRIESSNNKNSSANLMGAGRFDLLKKERRELILKVIKTCPSSSGDKSNGISIKDIILALQSLGEKWGEKTLQRELVSMVNDGVLNKLGEKRWSRYFVK